jgi:hypothetical protein
MKNSMTFLGLGFALALFLVCGSPAVGQSGYSYTADIGQTVNSTCALGEAVAVNGALQFQYSVTQDSASGDYRFQISIASSLSGVGQTTQTNYAENDSYAYGVTSPSPTVQITAQLQPTLAPQGSSANLILPQIVTINADASGNITATVTNGSTTCGR